jgi:hypothetical protein
MLCWLLLVGGFYSYRKLNVYVQQIISNFKFNVNIDPKMGQHEAASKLNILQNVLCKIFKTREDIECQVNVKHYKLSLKVEKEKER